MSTSLPTAVDLTAPVALVLELLAWVAARPRTYAEAMEAWRTSCPRFPVWEDVTTHGLVAIVAGDHGFRDHLVTLTPEGTTFLRDHSQRTTGRNVAF